MNAVDIVCTMRLGRPISDAAPIKSVPKIKIPILFIHGDEDKLVPYPMMEELFAAADKDIREKWTAIGAGHAMAMPQDKEKYFSVVFSFLDKVIDNKGNL